MRRVMMAGLCLAAGGCKPAKVFVVAAPAEGLELRSLELDVDRVLLEGCRGKSKSFDVDDTLDLLQPTGMELPRGQWCGLTLRMPVRKNDRPTLRMVAELSGADPFHLEARPAEGRVDQKFTLRKGKQAVVLDVGQWLDPAQLRADVRAAPAYAPETGWVLLEEPVTSAFVASTALSPALSLTPKKKLDSALRERIDAARSKQTERWSDDGSSGCNGGNGCASDGDSGTDKSGDTGPAGGEDSGASGSDTGLEKSCGDGCGGSGDGCAGDDDSGVYDVDTGVLVPAGLGLFALARRRGRT